eukprot:gene12334-8462_t
MIVSDSDDEHNYNNYKPHDDDDDDDFISEDSQRPEEMVYPLKEEVEVPRTEGKLFKTVLVEGTGRRPAKGSKVSVHYVGTLEDGTVFDSSRNRGQLFEFQLSKGQVIKGWDVGVATMRLGEKCVLKCLPDYAYGEAGHPPTIPQRATLNFEVELFAWTKEEDISAAKNRSILKRTLLDGIGLENPSIESKITLHLSIYAGGTDDELEALVEASESHNTKESCTPLPEMLWSKEKWEVEVGDTELPPCLEECLKKMRPEEVALFRIAAGLLPAGGCPTFHIPPPSPTGAGGYGLLYKVELLTLSTVKTWDFSGMAKVEQGMLRKNRANGYFQGGDYARAITFYRRALEFVGEDYGFTKEEEKKAAQALRVVVWGNLSQALLLQYELELQQQPGEKQFTHNPHEAAALLKKALDLEPGHLKNLFRISKAQDYLKEWEEAKRNLEKLLSLEPGNVDATAMLERVKGEIKAFDKQQKSLFSKMFA